MIVSKKERRKQERADRQNNDREYGKGNKKNGETETNKEILNIFSSFHRRFRNRIDTNR